MAMAMMIGHIGWTVLLLHPCVDPLNVSHAQVATDRTAIFNAELHPAPASNLGTPAYQLYVHTYTSSAVQSASFPIPNSDRHSASRGPEQESDTADAGRKPILCAYRHYSSIALVPASLWYTDGPA